MEVKSKPNELNVATDTAKNPDQTADHREPEPVLLEKPSKNKRMSLRRFVIKPVQNQEVEEIDLNGPTANQKSLNEKAEDVIKAAEVLKSKCEMKTYKRKRTWNLASARQIEALTSENHELARKLEIALGKLEVYEKINKSQAVIISDFKKTVEALARPTVHVDQYYLIGGDGGDAGAAGGGGGGGGNFYIVGK